MNKKQAPARRKTGQWRKGSSGNPRGYSSSRRALREDSWENTITNIGTVARDPRLGARYATKTISSLTARQLWRNSDLAARIVETHAAEALRRGFEIQLDDGQKDESEEIKDWLKEIPGPSHVGNGVVPVFVKALQYEAAYGGAAIWPVVNGAQGELSTEMREESITSVDRLVLFEPRELYPVLYYADPRHPKYGEPAIYEVRPLSTRAISSFAEMPKIHESRLILFPGIRVSREEQPGVDVGWGDSKLSRVYQVLADFELSFGGAAALLAKFSQVVVKLKGLAQTQATNEDFKRHLEATNLASSILNAWVVDSEDDVSRLAVTMAGLPDTLDKLMLRLAAAADMPVSLLMGQAPAGLNATGDSDIRFFYDRVEQLREHLKPLLERLVRWCMLAKDSPTGGTLPDSWCVEFPPLWEPSMREEIETRKMQAEIDKIEIEAGMITPEEAANSRHGGDAYSFETQLDKHVRREQTAILAPANQKPAKEPDGDQKPDDQAPDEEY